jgi:hypothetical protein
MSECFLDIARGRNHHAQFFEQWIAHTVLILNWPEQLNGHPIEVGVFYRFACRRTRKFDNGYRMMIFARTTPQTWFALEPETRFRLCLASLRRASSSPKNLRLTKKNKKEGIAKV